MESMYVFPIDTSLTLKIIPSRYAREEGEGETYCTASKMHYTHNAAVQDRLTNEGN